MVLWPIQMMHRYHSTAMPASTQAGTAVQLSVDDRDKPGHDGQVNPMAEAERWILCVLRASVVNSLLSQSSV
jgi:hypothetical protein